MERTIENMRKMYPTASDADLQRYIDLRDEGYSAYAARLMAGLSDPDSLDEGE